eukprot:TRINITY_DN2644_c0_g1_i1.p1 TRINITY_DN2644_c0_g1~~TRINITY_DN2644_c0_g1_i1.p1  ORF type:complete len:181 (-),score=18.65 TRINITY_DN2644_c0_g1_i1:47-589(-)
MQGLKLMKLKTFQLKQKGDQFQTPNESITNSNTPNNTFGNTINIIQQNSSGNANDRTNSNGGNFSNQKHSNNVTFILDQTLNNSQANAKLQCNTLPLKKSNLMKFRQIVQNHSPDSATKASSQLQQSSRLNSYRLKAVSYTHLRAHETRHDLVCRLLLEKKKKQQIIHTQLNATDKTKTE